MRAELAVISRALAEAADWEPRGWTLCEVRTMIAPDDEREAFAGIYLRGSEARWSLLPDSTRDLRYARAEGFIGDDSLVDSSWKVRKYTR